ncbi:hypothetical protein GDO78_019377 [Eleutherodactylus coqui]|uniref:Uncharacterized protein n=1 Tax=Eleutherodactylus coqui TaxID=57060 RepID=A0A8J6E7L7_ELECQ|nr:hypothetical protein GDO78_019377 [Eleutherodactylus coqui]
MRCESKSRPMKPMVPFTLGRFSPMPCCKGKRKKKKRYSKIVIVRVKLPLWVRVKLPLWVRVSAPLYSIYLIKKCYCANVVRNPLNVASLE